MKKTPTEVGPGDVILDLGCGDGRVLVTMAKVIGCRGIGVDISQVQYNSGVRIVGKHGSLSSVYCRYE